MNRIDCGLKWISVQFAQPETWEQTGQNQQLVCSHRRSGDTFFLRNCACIIEQSYLSQRIRFSMLLQIGASDSDLTNVKGHSGIPQ